jgi:hypothetical protein
VGYSLVGLVLPCKVVGIQWHPIGLAFPMLLKCLFFGLIDLFYADVRRRLKLR